MLGVHGHFSVLWLHPGGRLLHLIDSLGSTLAPDCPLAYVLEFGSRGAFLDFFHRRHRAASEAAEGDSDIAAGNAAALVEVHEFELVR